MQRKATCSCWQDPLGTGIAVAEIDLQYLRDVRRNMPIDEHRKLGLQRLNRSEAQQ